MKIRMETAFGLGVTASLVATLVMVLVRSANLSRLNLEMVLGALVTGSVGPVTWAIGCCLQLVAGGVFALAYACLFEAAGAAGWRRGFLLAGCHALITGAALALVPALHQEGSAFPRLRAPGFMAAAYGQAAVVSLVGMHALFGLIVGGGYQVRGEVRRAPMSHGPA